MSTDEPQDWFQAGHVPKGREPVPGRHVWTLQKGDRTLRCELRDDSRVGAGVDVQTVEGGTLVFSQRCPNEERARFLVASLRRDFLRDGWTDPT